MSADWPDSARVRMQPRAAYQVLDGRAVVVIPRLRMIHYLDEIATDLWRRLEPEVRVGDLVGFLLREYEVDEETARRDVREFLSEMLQKEMIEILPAAPAPPG